MEKELIGQNIWDYYHQVRRDRGYSMGDVAISNPYLTTSQLSRFESGQNMLSIDRFLAAVSGLNMTTSEFFALQDNQPSYYQGFSQKMMLAVMAKDILALKAMLKPNAKMKLDKLYKLIVKAAILDVNGEKLTTSCEKAFLGTYLLLLPHWTVFDVNLFSACIDILDKTEVYALGQDMLASNSLATLLSQNAEAVKKALLNLYLFFITRQYVSWAVHIQDLLEQLLTEWDMAEKISLHIAKNFLVYQQEKTPEMLAEIQGDFAILERFEVAGMAKRFRRIFDQLNQD